MKTDFDSTEDFGEQMLERITSFATPTQDEVDHWHHIDHLLETEGDRPLATALRFLVAGEGAADDQNVDVVDAITDNVIDIRTRIDLVEPTEAASPREKLSA